MSLILEALRRSEAERQRGRAPGLFVEQVPARRPASRGPAWALAGAAIALALVAAAWGWRAWRDGPGEVSAAAAPMSAPATAAPVAPPAAPAAATLPPASSPAPAGAFPPPRAETPFAAPAVAAPAPERVATSDAAPLAPPPAAAPATVAPPPPMPMPSAGDPVTAIDPAAPAVAAAADEPLPGLATLGAAERAGLPPLKLSMHVYSDDPARRFVIVDGQRLVEGAAPAAGVVVEAIRRDGAVLAINGRRVLLGRP